LILGDVTGGNYVTLQLHSFKAIHLIQKPIFIARVYGSQNTEYKLVENYL